ncbi:MAG: hypothetical protein AB7U59_13845 [Desulfovibrionaceae bacterium]
MIDALPIDVRQILDRMPAVTDEVEVVWVQGLAACCTDVCKAMLQGNPSRAREVASRLAAASIRLVEYLNQDWP